MIICLHVMAAQTEWSCYFHIAWDLHHHAGPLHDRLNNPRSTEEPLKTKLQPSSVGTSRIPSTTCTLFFKVRTRYISVSFYIICSLEFYRRVARLLICSWTSSLLYKQGILVCSAWSFYKPPFHADKSTPQILTQSTSSFYSVHWKLYTQLRNFFPKTFYGLCIMQYAYCKVS